MDRKAVFFRVKSHLLAQGRKSIDYKGCRYRDMSGLKCAIGCLIPDDLYCERLEGESVRNRLVMRALEASLGVLDGGDVELLSELQFLHDSVPVEKWASRLDSLERSLDYGPSESV